LSSPVPRAVAVVERDGKVLVIRRHLDGRDYAVLPGGGIEEGESAAQAAVRELREECGLVGTVAEVLLEADHGGRAATYVRITAPRGEPELGGEEAEHQDATNQYHPLWASPKDLDLIGLLPEGISERVLEWLWPANVRPAESDVDWEAVERLWQLYVHDLSEFRGTTPRPDGTYRGWHPGWDDRADPDRVAYVLRLGDRPVGFALLRGLTGDRTHMGEFFVTRSVRGAGHARAFAEHVVRRHVGPWEIAFQEDNVKAARFWRRLADEVLTDVHEEGREIPGKPYLPHDRWLSGTVGP
jgi:predicted acetyltransferase/ADP-ribose pyrophosphatase YjhB (NUDIX family)